MSFESPSCLELRRQVPDTWDVFSLESVTDFQEGPGILAKDFHDEGIPLLRLRNIETPAVKLDGCNFLDPSKVLKKWAHFRLNPGDLLISTSASLGRVSVVGENAAGSIAYTGIIRFRSSSPKLDHKYLRAFLSSASFVKQAEQMATGSVIKHFGPSHLRQMAIALPSLSEQIQIAGIFDALDDRIALLRETNATLEAIAQALFKSWFVDFDPVHANAGTQAPSLPPEIQALFPATFTDSPQGPIPNGWEWVTLDEISEVGIGKTPPRKEQHWFSESSNDTRWVSIRDMGMCGAYIATTSEFLTKEAVERFNVRVVPTNTVMLSFKMTIGRVAISDGAMTTNEAIAHFKLSEESPISSEFIYLHLKSFDYSTLSSTSSIADAVNSKTVKNIPILLADASVLAEFKNRIAPIFGKIKVIEQQAQTLATVRDTLLPRLISGQLRLPEEAAALAEVG